MVQEIEVPQILRQIPDPPKSLYILGHAELVSASKIIAIVGTRKPSKFGVEITAKIAKESINMGYTIISGMALGVDAVAHWTAIQNNSPTIAVLGAGPDIVYPPQNYQLYNSILEHNGLIVSEIPPGETVPRNRFAARNRIISGLAQAVVITECSLRSGTMVTAKLALDQGKDVYCVPGSGGTDYLISQGASVI